MKSHRALRAVVAVAALLRVSYVVLAPHLPLCNDCAVYDEVGWNLASGRGFVGGVAAVRFDRPLSPTPDAPEIGISPLYPGFLAVLYSTAGHRLGVVRLAQAVISTLTILPLYAVARRALGDWPALVAAALTAVYPAFIVYNGFLLTEPLATFLLVSAVAMVALAWQSRSGWRWLVAGVVSAAAILVRGEMLLLCAPIAILSLWRHPSPRTIGMLAVYFAAIALTMAPWIARNYRTFDRWIPVAARDGDTLWISVKGWREWHFDDPELQALVGGRDFLGQEDAMREAAVREIRAHPVRFAWTRLRRFPDFWLTSHTGNVAGVTDAFATYRARGAMLPLAVKLALLAVNTALIAAGLAGMVRTLMRRFTPEVVLLATPVIFVTGVHLALYATGRYHVPIMPFLLAFAGTLTVSMKKVGPA